MFLFFSGEANKLLSDYKYKLRKAEQEINTLQGSVSRLETQVARFKISADEAEKLEDELKAEKRKLQRDVRDRFNCLSLHCIMS